PPPPRPAPRAVARRRAHRTAQPGRGRVTDARAADRAPQAAGDAPGRFAGRAGRGAHTSAEAVGGRGRPRRGAAHRGIGPSGARPYPVAALTAGAPAAAPSFPPDSSCRTAGEPGFAGYGGPPAPGPHLDGRGKASRSEYEEGP